MGLSKAGDTYHNRYSKDSPYKGNKGYKKLPQKCQKCGSTENLDIDHIDGNRKNNNRSNLRVLCRSCHRKMHDGGSHAHILTAFARIIPDPNTVESQAVAASNKNSDLMHVEFILCHADKNENQDEFTPEDLRDSYATAVHKPINWGHTNRNIGVIYESKYIEVDNLAEADKNYYKPIDPIEKNFVVCKAAIWSYKHPEEAKVMKQRHAEGKLYFSMENRFAKATCSDCKETFDSSYEYCDHLLTRLNTKASTRIFVDSNFVAAAAVVNPADRHAGTLALASRELSPILYQIANAKCFSNLDINQDIIPYLLWREDFVMNKVDVPQDVIEKYAGAHEAFADDVNSVFPIDTPANIEATAKFVLNNDLPFYSKEDKLYVIEKLSVAARNNDIDITEYVNEGGIEPMIDRTSKEFQEAVAQAVQEEVNKIESGTKLKEAEAQLAEANKHLETTKKDLEQAQTSKAAVEKEFNEYKDSIAKAQKAQERYDTIVKAGLKIEQNADSLKTSIASMTDEQFDSFFSILKETAEAAKTFPPMMDEEEKKKKEEEDKKKKKEEAKASKDPVIESDVAIANKVDDNKPKASAIDTILKMSV